MPGPCELRSTAPRDRMGRRTSARRRWRRPTPCRIVEGRQILLHRAVGPLRIAVLAPILTCDRALLVGISLDQARIDCEAIAANQTGRNARLHNPLEHVAKYISLAEALVARARARRMIRDRVLDPE